MSNLFFILGFTFCLSAVSALPTDSLESNRIIIDTLNIQGNRQTRPWIIARELDLSLPDTFALSELEERLLRSRDNLLKTSLFNFVSIDTVSIYPGLYRLDINLTERWYTWPEFYLTHADRHLSNLLRIRDYGRLSYGFGIIRENFRGRNENLSGRIKVGFSNAYRLAYTNIFLDSRRSHSIDVDGSYENQTRMDYLNTGNSLQQFVSDKQLLEKYRFNLNYHFRYKLYTTHHAILTWNIYNITDTIARLNPAFLGNGRTSTSFASLNYTLEFDHRDLRYYPRIGDYFRAELTWHGIADPQVNMLQVRLGYHYFANPLGRWYTVTSLKGQLVNNNIHPYILTEALGYLDYLRGYERYVIDGHNFILFKSALKFEVLPTQIIHLPFIPFTQFNKLHVSVLVNIFFESGYVHDYANSNLTHGNSLVNRLLISYGTGMDIVTFYDKMIRVDLAHNLLTGWGIYLGMRQYF